MLSDFKDDAPPEWSGHNARLERACTELLRDEVNPETAFKRLTVELQRDHDISRGFLALRESDSARFLAVARFTESGTLKSLSLRVPLINSLFEKVAEDGGMYIDSFAEWFDGNTIEHRLLVGDSTKSFLLRPLKHDTHLIGLIGYSSDHPDAFVTFENGLLDPVIACLSKTIVGQPHKITP